jgi:hypothetical protein
MKIKISESQYNQLIKEILLTEGKRKKKKKKVDRCTRIAKRKYEVWPSAYASGAVVKCRQGKIWKNESLENDVYPDNDYEYGVNCEEKSIGDTSFLEEKKDFSFEKNRGLRGWFDRQGGSGKSKGWVDCNTCKTDKKTGRKKCKSCGRQEGEKRSKYPRCRPTPSQCKGYKRPDER